MILVVVVRALDVDHVWMTGWADNPLVIPALASAEVPRCVARVGNIRARLQHEGGATRLDRVGDKETAEAGRRSGSARIGRRDRARVTFGLIHPRVPVRRRRDRELTPRGAAAAGLARVDVRPRRAVVDRPPDTDVIGRRVDHARVCRIDRESRCAARRPKGRFERLARLRPYHEGLCWSCVNVAPPSVDFQTPTPGVPGGICETAPAVVEEMPCTPRPLVT